MYARAREEKADKIVEEMLAIADDPNIDPQRARVMVDTRKWIACKFYPKMYGDRVRTEVTGKDGEPLVSTDATLAVLEHARRVSFLLGRAVGRLEAREGSGELPAVVDAHNREWPESPGKHPELAKITHAAQLAVDNEG